MKAVVKISGRNGRVDARLGLPFDRVRDHQLRVMEDFHTDVSGATAVAHENPTGSGKSAIAVMLAIKYKLRTVILTSTKILQDQYARDFEAMVADIRGRNNYQCSLASNCELGYHQKCPDRGTDRCAYHAAFLAAQKSQIVVTNYSYWLSLHSRGRSPLGAVDLLVADEAHDSMDQLCGALACVITPKDLEVVKSIHSARPPWEQKHRPRAWADWADTTLPAVQATFKEWANLPSSQPRSLALLTLERLIRNLTRLRKARNRDWVVETGHAITVQPIWPRGFLSVLKGNSKFQYYMSATLRPKTLELIGAGDAKYREYGPVFDMSRCPIYFWPAGSMRYQNEPSTFPMIMIKIGHILRYHVNERGIVHTVSYARAKQIFNNSALRDRMVLHDSGQVQKALREYSDYIDSVLVSPVIDTGLDLKDDLCRYIITVKAPFADTRSRTERLRYQLDRDYYYYRSVMKLVQGAGRGFRSVDDYCRVYMLDADVGWLCKQNAAHLSGSFRLRSPEPGFLKLPRKE